MQLTRPRGATRPVHRLAMLAMLVSAGQPAAADDAPTAVEDGGAVADDAPSSVEGKVGLDAAGYADTDHVLVATPSLQGSVSDPVAGWSAGGQYLVDVVSAASVDIVASASRRWIELRHAGTLDASYKPGALGVTLDGALSSEPDYLAWSVGGLLSQDLLDDNLTLALGFSHGHDVAGRSGTPFSVFSRSIDREAVKAGATFTLDEATLASVLADFIFERGDTSKPYRYVPLFAPGASLPNGASIDEVTALRVSARAIEQLPQSRQRYALTVGLAHRFEHATLRGDERLYADSWRLMASTTDARYLLDLDERWQLGPHVRVHAQTPVTFWQRTYELLPDWSFPALRTGDRELGPLLETTLGLTLRWGIGSDDDPSEWLLGWDVNATDTRYFDHLYIDQRQAVVTAFSVEAAL